MAKKIDEETIRKINEVYLQCGVKSRTAQIVGVSASTVSKYIIPNYQSQTTEKEVKVVYDKPIIGAQKLIDDINLMECGAVAALCELCKLSEDEWERMKEIQKGLIV